MVRVAFAVVGLFAVFYIFYSFYWIAGKANQWKISNPLPKMKAYTEDVSELAAIAYNEKFGDTKTVKSNLTTKDFGIGEKSKLSAVDKMRKLGNSSTSTNNNESAQLASAYSKEKVVDKQINRDKGLKLFENNRTKDKIGPLPKNWPINIESCFVGQNVRLKVVHNASLSKYNNYSLLPQCSHLMTVIRKPSRNGNQMFQIAALLGAAKLHGYVPIIPPDFPIISIFQLPNVLAFDLENNNVFHEKDRIMYTANIANLSHSKNWTLTGYLQSWKYFTGCEGPVRKAFTFKQKYTIAAQTFLNNISKPNFQNICIHLRRFDKKWGNAAYSNPSPHYIYRAVEYFKEKNGAVSFILLSNDMRWVNENVHIKGAYKSPFTDPGIDMALMANCDHVILTAGTFGWWGGWLSGGTVVYWKVFVDTRSKWEKDFASAYYPTHWISMD